MGHLHLVKGSDGLDHCPVTGCEHAGFASKRGCLKHVKRKHGWYYYCDEKPTVCTSPCAIDKSNSNKESKTVPCCSTDNDFACSFQSSGFKAVAAAESLVNNRTFQ